MKKILAFLAIAYLSIGSTFATWEIDGSTEYSASGTVTACSDFPGEVGSGTGLYPTPDIAGVAYIDGICGANPIPNPITDLANTTGNGGISEAGNIMAGPIGYIIYFSLGLALLGTVIAVIKRFF